VTACDLIKREKQTDDSQRKDQPVLIARETEGSIPDGTFPAGGAGWRGFGNSVAALEQTPAQHVSGTRQDL
jgi:hypothetical protein